MPYIQVLIFSVFGSFVLRCFLEFGGFPRIVDLITCQLEEPPRFRLTKRAHDSIWYGDAV